MAVDDERKVPDPDDEIAFPPGGPLSDEPHMETDAHVRQMALLLECLDWVWRDRQDYFASGNLTIFFSPEQIKTKDFRGPDFFVVLGTERKPRNSWVVWHEGGKFPNVIVELLSNGTRRSDLGRKKQIYQDVFRTPEYFVLDPESGELRGFRLIEGRYEAMAEDGTGRLWSAQLGLHLGVSDGKLRLFTPDGEIVPTGVERGLTAERAEQRAEHAEQRAEHAEQRAEHAEQRAEALAAKLRALGVDPEGVEGDG